MHAYSHTATPAHTPNTRPPLLWRGAWPKEASLAVRLEALLPPGLRASACVHARTCRAAYHAWVDGITVCACAVRMLARARARARASDEHVAANTAARAHAVELVRCHGIHDRGAAATRIRVARRVRPPATAPSRWGRQEGRAAAAHAPPSHHLFSLKRRMPAIDRYDARYLTGESHLKWPLSAHQLTSEMQM